MKITKTKMLVLTSLFIALGVVIPIVFHFVPNFGAIFLPMHIPVLLCGMICGWKYGALCGLITPVISFLLTGMPPQMLLPSMVCELIVYGLISGLVISLLNTKSHLLNTYTALIVAMIAGRIVSGIAKATIFPMPNYSFQAWIAASFVTALPGIIVQFVIIPAALGVLFRSKQINKFA